MTTMLPEVINITIEQAEDFSKTFEKTNPDGSVYDLTGLTIEGKIRKHPEAVKIYNFNVGVASTAGSITVSLASSVTESIPWGRHYYDIFGTNQQGEMLKLYKGSAFINFSL